MFLKIENLIDKRGRADYKGLNTNDFIPGTQAYSNDFSTCYVETEETLETIPTDVTELTEQEYREAVATIRAEQEEEAKRRAELEAAKATKEEVQFLGQQLTELELLILENQGE